MVLDLKSTLKKREFIPPAFIYHEYRHPAEWVSDHPRSVRNAIAFAPHSAAALVVVAVFCFFIMIDTLYVYHRPVFSPKMTSNMDYIVRVCACGVICVFSPKNNNDDFILYDLSIG